MVFADVGRRSTGRHTVWQLKQEIGAPGTLPRRPCTCRMTPHMQASQRCRFNVSRSLPRHRRNGNHTLYVPFVYLHYAKLCRLQETPTDTLWFVSRKGLQTSLFSKQSRPVLELTYLPMQRISATVLGLTV
jgi:hypothetical protein